MARTYKRDSRGRFAGGGGGGSRPAARSVSRGTNRLTRNNAGQITGTGNGATARGGRLRTAAGNQRATQTARAKGGARAGVIKGRVTRNPGAMGKAGAKPVGWAQGKTARADRVGDAKGRKREADFLKSLPKPTRKAIRLAQKTRDNVGSNYRTSVLEGAVMLRSNFGKRKPRYSQGEANAISQSIQFSGRRLRAAQALPVAGKRLKRVGDERKASRVGKLTRQTPGTIKGTVKRNPQVGAKLANAKTKTAPKAIVKVAAKNAKPRKKTDQQILAQADRIIGKANKKSAAAIANVSKIGFQETARQVRRNNARSVMLVPKALQRRGLLETYAKLTAPADNINMRPAGPGIKQPKRRR